MQLLDNMRDNGVSTGGLGGKGKCGGEREVEVEVVVLMLADNCH